MRFIKWLMKIIIRKNKTQPTDEKKPLVELEHPPEYCINPGKSKRATEEEKVFTKLFQNFLKCWGDPNAEVLTSQWSVLKALPGLEDIPRTLYPGRVSFFLKVLTRVEMTEREITLEEVKEMLGC